VFEHDLRRKVGVVDNNPFSSSSNNQEFLHVKNLNQSSLRTKSPPPSSLRKLKTKKDLLHEKESEFDQNFEDLIQSKHFFQPRDVSNPLTSQKPDMFTEEHLSHMINFKKVLEFVNKRSSDIYPMDLSKTMIIKKDGKTQEDGKNEKDDDKNEFKIPTYPFFIEEKLFTTFQSQKCKESQCDGKFKIIESKGIKMLELYHKIEKGGKSEIKIEKLD